MSEGGGVDEVGGFVDEVAEGGGCCGRGGRGRGHSGFGEDVGFLGWGGEEVGEPFAGPIGSFSIWL